MKTLHMTARLCDGERPISDAARMLLDPATRTALVIGHPAHELRILEWMRIGKPATYVLASGSRNGNDHTRLAASANAITQAGASFVPEWGCVQDRELYRGLLEGRVDDIVRWTSALADDFVRRDIELVVADSWQLYNVAHDLAHVMARCAARRAAHILSRDIAVLDYAVVPRRLAPDAAASEEIVSLRLSPGQSAAKDALARSIPHLAEDLANVVAVEGPEGLAWERFGSPPPLERLLADPGFKPYYESYGEARVQQGTYDQVIRWSHVALVVRALSALD